jgi:hypothetical protein
MTYTKTLVRTTRNGTRIFKVTYPCSKCGGHGSIGYYMHIMAGVCFECNGTGICESEVKEYSEEFLEKKAAKAEAKEAARKAGWTPQAELKKMGYGEYIGIVTNKAGERDYGSDFEWLVKDGRCKYEKGCSGLLSPNVDRDEIAFAMMPATDRYLVVPVHWSELLDVDAENCHLQWKEKGAAAALKAHTCNFPKKPEFSSEFVGNDGEKIDFKGKIVKISGFETNFGLTNVYTFEDDRHNLLVWKTGKGLDFGIGDYVSVHATVKEHGEYRGEKQTVLTRCKVEAA